MAAVVLAATVFVVLPRQSEASSQINYSPGRLFVEAGSELTVFVHNPTDKDVLVSPTLAGSEQFTASSITPRFINAGNVYEDGFSCPGNAVGGVCDGNLVVTTSAKGVVVSARFIPAGSTAKTVLFSGDFTVFK